MRRRGVDRSHPAAGSGCAERYWRYSGPFWPPSCPCVPSSWPSPTDAASQPSAFAPSYPLSHTGESTRQVDDQIYLHTRRTRISTAGRAARESWRTPAADVACGQRRRTAWTHCVWASVAGVPAAVAGLVCAAGHSCFQERGVHRSCWGSSACPASTPSERLGGRAYGGQPCRYLCGAEGVHWRWWCWWWWWRRRRQWDKRQAAEDTGRFPGRATPSCWPSRSRR